MRPDTADLEVQSIQGGQRLSPAPSLAITEGDNGEPDKSGKKSTLQGYTCLFILIGLIHPLLCAKSYTGYFHTGFKLTWRKAFAVNWHTLVVNQIKPYNVFGWDGVLVISFQNCFRQICPYSE